MIRIVETQRSACGSSRLAVSTANVMLYPTRFASG